MPKQITRGPAKPMPLALKRELSAQEIRALGQGSVARVFKIFSSNPPALGTEETLQHYENMPWLRAINDKIGGALASLRWRAYVKVGSGEKGSRPILRDVGLQNAGFTDRNREIRQLADAGELVEVPDSPLIEALYNEGSNFTGVTRRELTQKYLDLVGEAFWIKIRNSDGMPVEFLPVPPHWVAETPTTEKPFFSLNVPNAMTDRYDNRIPPEDMIWYYHPKPYNPYERGVGMGKTLADELETDEYAAKFLKSFFYNQARPDFLIHADNLDRDDTERLEQRWMDKLRGFFRGFTPFFSNRKLEVTRLTADYGHLQMLDLRAAQRDTCLQVYGAQPEIFGITEASNRATSEVAEYLFSRWVIVPRAEFLRAIWQARLVPDYDDRIILHYDSPIAYDKDFKLKAAAIAPWTLDIDEWRELMELMPLPGGRGQGVFCKPLNYEFYDIDDPLGSQQQPIDSPAGEDDDDDPPDDSDEGEETPADEGEMEEGLRDEFVGYVEECRGIAWVKVDQLTEALENQDYDRALYDLALCLDDYESLGIAVQKTVIRQGLKTAESIQRWLPKDAKVEPYNREMHMYVADGVKLLNEWRDRAMLGAEDAMIRLLEGLTPRKTAEMLAAYIGLSDDDWDQILSSPFDDWDDVAASLDERMLDSMPARIAADAISFAQLQVAREAMKNGFLAKRHIQRVWKTSTYDHKIETCEAMNGEIVNGSDFWEMEAGATVALPTRSHPDCHCRERLVVNGGEA